MNDGATPYTDELLKALASWQSGWRENQEVRLDRASALANQCVLLPEKHRSVKDVCFRKRFLHKGVLTDIVVHDELDEGTTSWTIDKRFAERFKGLVREDAVTAAIFAHRPLKSEVVVNIVSLWQDDEFIAAVTEFKNREPETAKPLIHFRAEQGEVVLTAPLRGSEIVALTGVSSPFDDLCDSLEIPEAERDEKFKALVQSGVVPEEPVYTSEAGSQRVIARTIDRMYQKLVQE